MKIVGVIVILWSSVANTAPHEGYVELGGMVGFASPVLGPHAMAAIGAGVHLDGTLWLRGLASYGPAADVEEGSGTNRQLRAGIESQLCSPDGYACFTPAFDVGVQRGHWEDRAPPSNAVEDTDAVVLVPRIGGDFGKAIRFRIGLEVDLALTDKRDGLYGIDLTTGIATRW